MIDRMLDNSAVKVMLAVEPSDHERILGWIAYTAMARAVIVHYVYVRDKVRGRGIAQALLSRAKAPVFREQSMMFTMRGPDADWLAQKYPGAIEMSVNDFLDS